MNQEKNKYYPTFLQAVHLVVLYIFIQTVIDFPLAVIDYYYGTDYLYLPIKKVVLGVGSVLFILYYGYRKSKSRILEIFPLRFFNPLILIFVATFIIGAHVLISEANLYVEKYIPPPTWFVQLFNNIFESDYGWLGAFAKVVVIAPVIEELIFRGVIIRGFMRNYPKFLAVFLSALLFALFHLNPWQFPATFVLGLLLGWLMVRTHNIILCIITHAINNFVVLLTVAYWEDIQQSAFALMEREKQLSTAALVVAFSVVVIILLSFKRVKKPADKNLNS
ncbi:MAG: CPBP family intramembrane metalloprotease [Prolixibacteraceae bacterium]|nr:CPBP family intramembrane metalloprotease [Prolixibacteraceae bacterium]MBN2773133.1 CPBP family intramembrane metalloprotease [Prolixibacteraceae bacterium]